MNEEYGTVGLKGGHKFIWIRTSGNEIAGHIEKPDMSVLKGTYGFWRTNDEQAAAKLAEELYLRGVE